MEVSEKKLGCLAGTKRTNLDKCGYIEGSVNTTLKSGQKEVCVQDGKAIFWIVNDYDVTVTAEDVKSYSIAGVNVFTRESSSNVNNQRVFRYEYTVNYDIEFTNGTSGILKVASITVLEPGTSYDQVNRDAFKHQRCPSGYAAEVVGWLNPDGAKDDKYHEILCPEGYSADIIGFRKISVHSPCVKLTKALGLVESPLHEKVEFGGQKIPFIRVKK